MASMTSPSKAKALRRGPAHLRMASFYSRSFEKRPLLTISIANSALGFTGDVAAQLLPILQGSGPVTWDIARSLRFFAYGFALGPVAGKWNELLENRLPLRAKAPLSVQPFEKVKVEEVPLHEKTKAPYSPSNRVSSPLARTPALQSTYPATSTHVRAGRVSLLALLKRVLADQLLMAPLGIFVFISSMCMMEGLTVDAWLERLKRLFLPILLVNWQVWPFIQAINFRFMPLKYRVPFTASCGIVWTIFLSIKQAAAAKGAELPVT